MRFAILARSAAATPRSPRLTVPHRASHTSSGMDHHIESNRAYVQKVLSKNSSFFETLDKGQTPGTLWVGCSDSRVPETTVLHAKPGDIFVHRNIANIVHEDDINLGSVIEYGVKHLKVKRIVVCGHTKCGGAAAALGDADLGQVLNKWLSPLRELRRKHQAELDGLASDEERAVRLAELNVLNGLDILKGKETVRQAMEGRGLEVHGAIFQLFNGEVKPL